MYKQDGYSPPVFGRVGYCILDFQLQWMMDAIYHQNPDDAYKYARMLYHTLFMGKHQQRRFWPANGRGFV